MTVYFILVTGRTSPFGRRMSGWNDELHLRHDHHRRSHLEQTTQTPLLFQTASPPPLNFSQGEVDEMERVRNETLGVAEESVGFLYTVAVPVMCFFCLITVVVNLVIVAAAHWCRKPMSPTLYFSISLVCLSSFNKAYNLWLMEMN